MGRPNYQRILNAHGKLPESLQRDFGLRILETESEGTAEVVDTERDESFSEETTFESLVDKESGKKLTAMNWAEIKAKATKDKIYKPKMKRVDILKAYLELAEGTEEEVVQD